MPKNDRSMMPKTETTTRAITAIKAIKTNAQADLDSFRFCVMVVNMRSPRIPFGFLFGCFYRIIVGRIGFEALKRTLSFIHPHCFLFFFLPL